MRPKTNIKNIDKIPRDCGVYFLLNKKGDIFYIGKSNNLRSRVSTHAKPKDNVFKGSEKIENIEWIKTANEVEALLREREYIQRFQPKLNANLKDGKQYLYIGITIEDYPRIYATHQPAARKRGAIKSEYIGPFTDARAIKRILRFLRRWLPYYSATDKNAYFQRAHPALKCPYCHIKMCPGPNPDKTIYRRNVAKVKRIISGQHKQVRRELKKQMASASRKKDFEKAAAIRDKIYSLDNIFAHKSPTQNWNVKTPRDYKAASKYIANLVGAELPVRTIEGYDISNTQGRQSVASLVRFQDGRPNKSLYRSFNIKLPEKPNDVLMIQEAISRRLKRTEWPYPDLFLIDGGRGQLNAALKELKKNNASIPVVALAKKLEELYMPDKNIPILLSKTPKEVEYLLRNVRDEAHRFAKSRHIIRRKAAMRGRL